MKKSISSIELAAITKELQQLVDGKISKLWVLPDKELLFQFHLPNKGRVYFKLTPDFCYLTDYKSDTPEKPHGFCMFLRKYLNNARIRSVRQVDFERILEIVFEKKEGKYHFFAEIFSPGNYILTDDTNKIMSAMETQKWKDREVMKGNQYIYPQMKYNFMELKEPELKKLLAETDKESVVKTLAIELGLGGIYATELMLRAGIDKEKNKLDENETKKLFREIKKLRMLKLNPQIIEQKDIVPFDLKFYEEKSKEKAETYNKALDKILTQSTLSEKSEEIHKEATKYISKEERIAEAQEKHIIKLKQIAEENQKKAEAIYHNYQLIDEVLKELNKARKTHSFKEIKEKLKGHKMIKEVKEKENEVVIEI